MATVFYSCVRQTHFVRLLLFAFSDNYRVERTLADVYMLYKKLCKNEGAFASGILENTMMTGEREPAA